jgi:hypothetical protein
MKVPIFIEGLRTSIVAGCGQLIMTRPVARAQAVRDVIEAHTGATPPPLPPQPPAAPYGRVRSTRACRCWARCRCWRPATAPPPARLSAWKPSASGARPAAPLGQAVAPGSRRVWGPEPAHSRTGASAAPGPATNPLQPGRGRRMAVPECDWRQAATASWQETPGSAWNRPPCTGASACVLQSACTFLGCEVGRVSCLGRPRSVQTPTTQSPSEAGRARLQARRHRLLYAAASRRAEQRGNAGPGRLGARLRAGARAPDTGPYPEKRLCKREMPYVHSRTHIEQHLGL